MLRSFVIAAALLAATSGAVLAQSEQDSLASPVLRANVTVSSDVVRIGDFLVIGSRPRNAPIAEPLFEQGLVGVTDGDQFGPRINMDPGNVVVVGDRAGPDHRNPHGVTHLVRSLSGSHEPTPGPRRDHPHPHRVARREPSPTVS